MALRDLYSDDLIGRFSAHTFTETPIGSMTLLEFKNGSSVVVASAKKLGVLDAYKSVRETMLNANRVLPRLTQTQIEALSGIPDGFEVWNITHDRLECFTNDETVFTNNSTTYFDGDDDVTANGQRCGVDTTSNTVTLTVDTDTVFTFYVFDAYKTFDSNSCFVEIGVDTYELDKKEKFYEFSYNPIKTEWKYYEIGMKVKS